MVFPQLLQVGQHHKVGNDHAPAGRFHIFILRQGGITGFILGDGLTQVFHGGPVIFRLGVGVGHFFSGSHFLSGQLYQHIGGTAAGGFLLVGGGIQQKDIGVIIGVLEILKVLLHIGVNGSIVRLGDGVGHRVGHRVGDGIGHGIGVGIGSGGGLFAAGGQQQGKAQGQRQDPGQLFHVVSSRWCHWC